MLLPALAVLGACSGEIPTSSSLAIAGASRSDVAVSEPFALVANEVVYRNTSVGTAHGRSGSAALSARVLLGRDNVGLLEISTGDLDGPTPAGSIDRAQVKIFDPSNGRLAETDNFRTRTGGYWSHAYPSVVHDQRVQVQANISGIDPRRTDVVTVDAFAKWRPDLHPGGIGAPAQALVGTPVNFVVPVHELNGDLGARADCVLYADGVAIDRSLGIWVDRADVVTCLFRATFATPGVKRIEARVEHVQPADYDDSNNVAFANIEIVDPVASFHGVAMASNVVTGSEQASGRAALFPRVDFLTTIERRAVRTLIDATLSFPRLGSVQVLVSRETEGSTFGSTLVQLDPSDGCAVRITTGQLFSLCGTGPGTYQLFWSTTQGTVAFWSLESQAQWNGTRYVYSSTGLPPGDPPQPERWGNSLTLHVSVTAGDRVIEAAPVITLVPFDVSTSVPYGCVAGACTGSRRIEYGVAGQAVF